MSVVLTTMYFTTFSLGLLALTASAVPAPIKRADDLGTFQIERISAGHTSGRPGTYPVSHMVFGPQEIDNNVDSAVDSCNVRWDMRGEGWPHGPVFCDTNAWSWYFSSHEGFGDFTLELTHAYADTVDGQRMWREKYGRMSFSSDGTHCSYGASGIAGCTWTNVDIPVYNQSLVGPY